MSAYSYKLYKNNKDERKNRYKEKDLRLMTTFQLREICNKEKLVKSIINPLDKDELVRLIMRYRGEEETLFINGYEEEGITRLETFLKKTHKFSLNEKEIQYPTKITLYEDIDLDIFDNYVLESKDGLDQGNMLLVNESFQICAIFNLIKVKEDKERFYITRNKELEARKFNCRQYNLLYLSEKDSDIVYDIYYDKAEEKPTNISFHSLQLLEFDVRQISDTNIPLAIDFGTSNTTAGIYINKESSYLLDKNNSKEELKGNEVNFVKVINNIEETIEISPLIPSIVAVRATKDEGMDYIFGYDAVKASKVSYVDEGLTLFYDIKRWINDYDRLEEIKDIEGKKAFISRKDIIKAYLEYTIGLAKQRFKLNFKNIHISSPAKQKYKFYMLFKDILTDYVIENENTLEEGTSVLFNTIFELIENKKYMDGERYRALIIDCGGGTTDLSSCEFTIRNNRVSYEIDVETTYENGDTDFGGNNLTYRLLQLIKVIMAAKLRDEKSTIKDKIIDDFDIDIFRFVDENGSLPIYERLNEEYEKAEDIIPTKFKNYEGRSKDDYYKVRNNYYFLFDLAEEVKKIFFNNQSLLDVRLSSEEGLSKAENLVRVDKWKVSILKDNRLQEVKDNIDMRLSVYDINTLLKADIYNIIKRFLEKLYHEGKLQDISLIKLTGQSCKVEIFKDALKEFIPGRLIQFKRNNKTMKTNYDLKLSCLRGAVKYLQAKKFGYANITLKTKTPILPYVITAYTHRGEEKTLIHSTDRNRTKGTISRFMEMITLKLYLKDTNGLMRYEYGYEVNPDDFREVVPEEITSLYKGVINQHETDNIINDEVKFFVWAREEEWGFSVLPILRKEEKLFMGKEEFFSFENDQWETNFFDGLK